MNCDIPNPAEVVKAKTKHVRRGVANYNHDESKKAKMFPAAKEN